MKNKYILLLLTVILGIASCSDKTGALIKPELSTIPLTAADFVLTVTKDNIPADDYTYAEVSLELKNAAVGSKGISLIFSTDNATFSNGEKTFSVPLAADGATKVLLKSSRALPVTVNLNVAEKFTKSVNIQFLNAAAEAMTMETAQASISHSSASGTGLKSTLSRLNGNPTSGQVVNYYDSAATGIKSVGTFLNVTRSDVAGISRAEYFLQDTTFKGFVYLKSYIGSGNTKVSATTRILVK